VQKFTGDPISQALQRRKEKKRVERKYRMSVFRIPEQTLHEESPALHAWVRRQRA
jgi:hypothetical protein